MGNDVRRRTPMGKADAKASNHVLVGLGVGIITAVSGLSERRWYILPDNS